MNQSQVEQWIAQQGGPGAVQYSSEKRRVANPAYAMTLPNGDVNPQYAPGQPPTTEVASEMWVNSKTGAKLHVSRKDDNSFDVIENSGADPNKPPPGGTQTPAQTANTQAQTANTQATTAATIAEEAEKDANAKAGRGRITDAAWQTRQTAAEAAARAAGNQEEANRLAQERLAFDREKENRPVSEVKQVPIDGQIYFTQTVTPKDGLAPTIRSFGPDGKPIATLPTPGAYAPEPSGGPKPSLSLGDAAADMRAYQDWLNSQIGTGPGKITVERADKLSEARRKTWEIAIKEQEAIVGAQQTEAGRQTTEHGQTLQDQGNRRNSVTQIADTASTQLYPYMDKLGANASGADFLSAVRYARGSAQDFVNGTGVNAPVPTVTPGPALAAATSMNLPGGFLSSLRPTSELGQPGDPTLAENTAGRQQAAGAGAPAPQTFTMRNKQTGEVRTMTPDQLRGLDPNVWEATASTGGGAPVAAAPQPTVGADGITRASDGSPYTPGPITPYPQQPGSWFAQSDGQRVPEPQARQDMPKLQASDTAPPSGTTQPQQAFIMRNRQTGDRRVMTVDDLRTADPSIWEAESDIGSASASSSVSPAPAGVQWVPSPGDPGYRPPSGAAPFTPYNPAPGQPGHQAGKPVGQMAPPPGFLASMRPLSMGGGYDPGTTAQAMFADPNWDNAIVAQALRELYPDHPLNRVA